MPLNFQSLAMMELRSSPGEVLDRVALKNESFIVERNGQKMACLVPLSLFMPDIKPARLAKELELLYRLNEKHTTSINDERELEFHCRGQGFNGEVTLTVRLPHGYPNACPKVFADPLPDNCPHRWPDKSLCIFGSMEVWNPGRHDIAYVLSLARRWLAHFATWQHTGTWGEENESREC